MLPIAILSTLIYAPLIRQRYKKNVCMKLAPTALGLHLLPMALVSRLVELKDVNY